MLFLANLSLPILRKKTHKENSNSQIDILKLLKSLFVAMSWPKDTTANSRRISNNFELPPTPPIPSSLHMEGQNMRTSATGCETSWYHRWSWNNPSNSCGGFDIATDETARLIPSPYIVNFLQSTDNNQNYRTCR